MHYFCKDSLITFRMHHVSNKKKLPNIVMGRLRHYKVVRLNLIYDIVNIGGAEPILKWHQHKIEYNSF